MHMFNPSHPGRILASYVGERSVTEVAEHLGVTRVALSRVINGNAGISAEMALRIGKLFDTDPEFWLRMQAQRDLWEASQDPPIVVPFSRKRSIGGQNTGRPAAALAAQRTKADPVASGVARTAAKR